jgi:Glycosyl transferase family 90
MYNYLEFSIKSERPALDKMVQYETRGDSCFEMLRLLLRLEPQLSQFKKGIIFFGDTPPDNEVYSDDLLCFCTTKLTKQSSLFLPFPCPHSLRWPQVGIPDSEYLLTSLLEDARVYTDNRIFWIGANTHPTRVKLTDYSASFNKILEAHIIQWQPSGNGKIEARPRFISLQDHANYKYLIDCPGNGYSGRLKWLLATGRPTFVVERDVVEHWHDEMIPWVHYVPIASDLSDIISAYDKLENDSILYRYISEHAKAFVRDHISLPQQLLFTANHLSKSLR